MPLPTLIDGTPINVAVGFESAIPTDPSLVTPTEIRFGTPAPEPPSLVTAGCATLIGLAWSALRRRWRPRR